MAGTTRLELATSAVTGQRSNQLNYVPALAQPPAAQSLTACHRFRIGLQAVVASGLERAGWTTWMLNGGQIGVKSSRAVS